MAALILFALLFLCGLLNSVLFRPSKLFPWLRSLLLSTISPPKPRSKPHKPELNNQHDDRLREPSENLRTVFETFDADADGYVTVSELADSLRRLGIHADGAELINMMERTDANGDGFIDLNEFSELCGSLKEGDVEDRELREAFDVFDGNGDSLISVEELSSVLKSLGLRQGDRAEDCREMIESVDLDGDGMVNFEEFKRMMALNGGSIFCY